jgi:hypothetical protein
MDDSGSLVVKKFSYTRTPLLRHKPQRVRLPVDTIGSGLQLLPRIGLVIPGRSPETSFGKNAQTRMQGDIPGAYADFAQSIFAGMRESPGAVTHASDVVHAVFS